MFTSRSRSPLLWPLLFAFLGVLFAAWNAWDSSSVPCITAGCTLYQGFTFAGISLWWGGIAAFAVLGLLAFMGHAALGRTLAGLGLVLDCILLSIMVLTLPCLSCLTAALLLALCFITFRVPGGNRTTQNSSRPSVLVLLWSALFIVNIGVVIRSEFQPWVIQPSEASEGNLVRIFFSPSCTACRQLVTGMPEADVRKVTWCPIAEEEGDLAVILDLQKRLAVSVEPFAASFTRALEAPRLTFLDMLHPETLLVQFRLWRNQARVISVGEGRLPLVEFVGTPIALLKSTPARTSSSTVHRSSPNTSENLDFTLPIDLGDAGSCGGSTTRNGAPCP